MISPPEPFASPFARADMKAKRTPVIAAISGGPDSMALLSLLEERKIDYAICHVNYHKRETAARDEAIVRGWAAAHDRALYILHPAFPQASVNFQAWARDVRYDFFVRIAHALDAGEIWLAHHQDDLIETWMIQKERQSIPLHYGIAARIPFKDLELVRPFLNLKKAELKAWCDRKQIPYGLDESNESDAYLRNRFRHQFIEKADDAARLEWLAQIEADNRRLARERNRIDAAIQSGQADFLKDKDEGWKVLSQILFEKTGRRYSQKSLKDMAFKLACGNMIAPYGAGLNFQVIDGRLESAPPGWIPFYIDSPGQMEALCAKEVKWACFQLKKHGRKIESFALASSDFPLIVRAPEPGDVIGQRFGHKKISRLLIDRKIPALYRPFAPVIESQNGIVFAALAGCDPAHYMENAPFSMLKLAV